MQTNISPSPTALPSANKNADWLAGLEAGTDLKPSFFRPETRPQRVVVMGFTGFGAEGKQVELHQKDAAGNPVTKRVPCFCEVQLQDDKTGRSYVWQVLSRPTVAKLRRVLADAGPACFGALVIDVHATGRGYDRETFIEPVKAETAPAEEPAEHEPSEKDAIAEG